MRWNKHHDGEKECRTVPVSKMNSRVMFGKDERNGASISDVRKRRKGILRVQWSMMECRRFYGKK